MGRGRRELLQCESHALGASLPDSDNLLQTAEIEQVVDTVLDLLSDKALALKPEEIGVISPWREQVWRLRDALRKIGQWKVNVGHVEAYQGAEYRCIVISCVRSERSLVQRDKKFGSGLIFEPKR